MKRIPRLLPLTAVAIVGVLAVNFMAGARSLPEMIGAAKAFAEAAAPKGKENKDEAKHEEEGADKADSPLPSEAGGAAITAASLAANADGICSPAEMKYLSDLQARRGQLDAREGDIDTQLKLIEAAEAKLNAKIAELGGLKTDINGLLGQVDAKQAAETARLVKVYSNMKPQVAAATMATLNDEVRLPIAMAMKELNLSAILNKMTPAQAKDLTEKMAQRYAAAKAVTQARSALAPGAPAQAAAPATAPQAAAPPAKAPVAKQAAAEPKPPAPRPRPKTQARAPAKPATPAAAAPAPKADAPAEAAAPPTTG